MRAAPGDGDTAVRDLVARREPLFEFAIRSMLREHNLDSAEGRVAALQRTVPLVARIRREDLRDEYARRLAGWTSWDDIAMVVRRVRETAGAPGRAAAGRPRRREAPAAPRRRTTRGCTCSARRSRPRCRSPRSPARATTSCPSRRSPTPRSPRCTARCRRPAGCAAARGGSAWLEAVLAQCPPRSARWSPSWRWSRWSCPGATVGSATGTPPTRPATSPASSPGCGWCWSRPRSRS